MATLEWYLSENSVSDFNSLTASSAPIRFRNANYNTNDNTNPLVLPGSGTNYSFEKALLVYVTDDTGITQLQDLKVKLDASPATGTQQTYRFLDAASYTQPQQPSEGTGGVGGPMPGGALLTTSELDWGGSDPIMTDFTGLPKVWTNSDILYTQLEVGSTAATGPLASSWNVVAVYNEL